MCFNFSVNVKRLKNKKNHWIKTRQRNRQKKKKKLNVLNMLSIDQMKSFLSINNTKISLDY